MLFGVPFLDGVAGQGERPLYLGKLNWPIILKIQK